VGDSIKRGKQVRLSIFPIRAVIGSIWACYNNGAIESGYAWHLTMMGLHNQNQSNAILFSTPLESRSMEL